MSLPCVSWHPSATTSSYVRASSMSVCSFDVGRCTLASHCAPAFLSDACHHRTLHHCWLRSTGDGESFLPLLLLLSCSPPPPFKVRFSLLTPRFRRAACATSAVGASFHATALTARFLLGLFLFPLVKALLPPSGWQSFTRHLSLHSSPSLCTHEAVSSVRSNAFCVHDIWLLRLLFHFSTAKLRQAVCLKYRLAICFTKMSAAFRTFPVWLLVKSGYSNIFP